MLDENGYIKRFDTDDALGVAAKQPEQLRHRFASKVDFEPEAIKAIVVAGMGGSALAADLVRGWQFGNLKIPFVIVRDYNLPEFVNESTLVVCSSYSGNTEETLNIYAQARTKQAKLVVMASGGKLSDLAQKDGVSVYALPGGYQPRMAVWYGVKALAELLESLNFTPGAAAELEEVSAYLEDAATKWQPEQPTSDNYAKKLAEEMLGKTVWIYAGPRLSSAAYKWKININENAKQVAAFGQLPEFNHNEFIGWTEQPRQKPFTIIQLISDYDHDRINKRFEVSNRLLSGRMPHPIIIKAEGETNLQQLLQVCLLGDFTSIYLGILNGVNPTKVDLIEKLKQELG